MVRVWRGLLAIAVAVGFALAGFGTVSAAATDAAPDGGTFDAAEVAQGAQEIQLTQRFSQLPDQPGSVSVELEYSVPSAVVSLSTVVPENATVTGLRGFERDNATTYAWDGEHMRPSVTYRYDVNRTVDRSALGRENGTYLSADGGDWALFTRPETHTDYSYPSTDRIVLERTSTVDGEGAVGEWLVFLGPQETFTASSANESVRLVVPDAAEMTESPRSVLRALLRAGEHLGVGRADEEVFVVAAPAEGVPWAVRGFQIGDADMWVLGNESLDAPESVWYHEYVHTRQDFETARDARWLDEALPSYYATLLTFEHQELSFDGFAGQLASGGEPTYDDVVLASPDTWQGVADYYKGGLAVATLDREIRIATDGNRTFQDVLAALNDRDRVNASVFVDAVERVGGDAVATRAATATGSSTSVAMWNRTEHLAAFDRFPADIGYALPNGSAVGYEVTGPYRETTVTPDSPLSVVTDETVTVEAVVTNDGGSEGRYEAVLRLNGTRVDAARGTVGPNETTTVPLEHTFVFPGTYELSVDGHSVPVEVRRPAVAEVTDVAVQPRTVDQYETATVDVFLTNEYDEPAEREVIVTRDFEVVTRETVSLGATESGRVSYTVTFPQPGDARIGVNREAAIRVMVNPAPTETGTPTPTATPPSPTATPTATATEGTGPGFGVATLVAALALAALLARRRQ